MWIFHLRELYQKTASLRGRRRQLYFHTVSLQISNRKIRYRSLNAQPLWVIWFTQESTVKDGQHVGNNKLREILVRLMNPRCAVTYAPLWYLDLPTSRSRKCRSSKRLHPPGLFASSIKLAWSTVLATSPSEEAERILLLSNKSNTHAWTPGFARNARTQDMTHVQALE